MKRKLKKEAKIMIGVLIGLIVTICVGFIIYSLTRPSLTFVHNKETIEIHQDYDAKSFIKDIKGYDEKNIKIDDSLVNKDKLGKYKISYSVDDDKYELDIEVVDTVAPTYDVTNIDLELGVKPDLNQIVKNIKDQTKTKTYFKEDYSFDKEGLVKATVVVEDEAENKTEKEVQIKVIKDTEKPVLKGLQDLNVTVNHKIDYLDGITAKDNFDPKPEIKVNSNKVNLSKVGTYDVVYTVSDRSGNKNTYTKKVYVKEKTVVTTKAPTGNKIMYLTFDDGPSGNTAKILDILAKYNAKATFFVTGNNQKYNYLIKRAHNEGHTIALHTYTHDYKKIYSSVDAYFNDLNKIGNMVKNQIGFVPKYIRFPGGASNTVSRKYSKGIMSTLTKEVQARGYQYYDWNASTGDASGNNVAVSKIIKSATSSKSNNIMLLGHDTAAKGTTVQALPKIIEHYQALGYSFKGISDSSFTPHQGVNN